MNFAGRLVEFPARRISANLWLLQLNVGQDDDMLPRFRKTAGQALRAVFCRNFSLRL